MKETKTYFAEDNKLNKGYAKYSNSKKTENVLLYSQKFEQLLPELSSINDYEEIYPGTLSKLIDMAEQEQAHRHKLNIASLEAYNKASRIGKIFGLLYVSVVCIAAVILGLNQHEFVAIVFASIAFLAIIVVTAFEHGSNYHKKEGKKAPALPFRRR